VTRSFVRNAFPDLIAAAALAATNVGSSQVVADNTQQAQEAIALLGRFPIEVEKITTAISRIVLPTGGVSYTCVYTAFAHAAGVKTLHYSSQTSFSGLDSGLQPRIQAVHTSSKRFADSFTPILRQWAQTALPRSSVAFSNASVEVLAVQDEMKRGIGPSESQRTRVIGALDRILASLNTGKGELTTMNKLLSGYLQEQRAARGSLSDWSTTASGQIQSRAQKIREDIDRQRCKGDGLAKLAEIERNANASIATIKTRIEELQRRDAEADSFLALLSGTLPAMKRWPVA
jgi:hypothetical protein